MRIDWDVPIEVDDGLVLRADVFRPDDDEGHPVLVTYGPYAKGLHFQDGYADQWKLMVSAHPDVAAASSNRYQALGAAGPREVGAARIRLPARGLARCRRLARGRRSLLRPRDRGLLPMHRVGGRAALEQRTDRTQRNLLLRDHQWQVAARRPPHLAAICPWEGAADWYRDSARHGGILCTFSDNWYGHQVEPSSTEPASAADASARPANWSRAPRR